MRDTAELLDLKTRLASLSPGDRLRLAAGLIDKGKYSIAETITSRVVDELRAVRLLVLAREGKP